MCAVITSLRDLRFALVFEYILTYDIRKMTQSNFVRVKTSMKKAHNHLIWFKTLSFEKEKEDKKKEKRFTWE